MPASAWELFNRAKRRLALTDAAGPINLNGAFKMTLVKSVASFSGDLWSTYGSIGANEITATGFAPQTLDSVTWTGKAAAGDATVKFDCADEIFTASTSNYKDIKYAMIFQSLGASSGRLLCYAQLSSSAFTVNQASTLTVQMNANGIFVLY